MASAILTLPEGPPVDCSFARRLQIGRGDVSLGLRGSTPQQLPKTRRSARRRMAKLEGRCVARTRPRSPEDSPDRRHCNTASLRQSREETNRFLASLLWQTACDLASMHGSGSQVLDKELCSTVGIQIPAGEYVDGRVAALRPGVNGQVRLGDDDYPADSMRRETVEGLLDHRRSDRIGGTEHRSADAFERSKSLRVTTAEFQQQMPTGRLHRKDSRKYRTRTGRILVLASTATASSSQPRPKRKALRRTSGVR